MPFFSFFWRASPHTGDWDDAKLLIKVLGPSFQARSARARWGVAIDIEQEKLIMINERNRERMCIDREGEEK